MPANDDKLEEARDIADKKAASILLDDFRVVVTEKPQEWDFTYGPKARVRGGGFRITISKVSKQVTNVEHFQ